jgi:hypothetical protein
MENLDNLLSDLKTKYPGFNPIKRNAYTVEFRTKNVLPQEVEDELEDFLKKNYPGEYTVENFYEKEKDKINYPRIIKQQVLAKQVKESDRQKVEEAITNYFKAKTNKYDSNPSLKGKQATSLPDKLQAAIIKKKGGKVKEEAMLFTNDFAKQDQVNYIDDEGRMAKQQLFKIKKYAQELCDMLDDNTQLEGWVQAKITKAEEAIGAVKHYMEYEMFRKQQG